MSLGMTDYAMRFVGVPYIYGGKFPFTGIDCSGLICEVLQAFGHLHQEELNAQGIYNYFCKKLRSQLAENSLLFFGENISKISHVAMAISDKLMIESGGGDHTTINIQESQKRKACVRIRPITHRKDLVAVLKIE